MADICLCNTRLMWEIKTPKGRQNSKKSDYINVLRQQYNNLHKL